MTNENEMENPNKYHNKFHALLKTVDNSWATDPEGVFTLLEHLMCSAPEEGDWDGTEEEGWKGSYDALCVMISNLDFYCREVWQWTYHGKQ